MRRMMLLRSHVLPMALFIAGPVAATPPPTDQIAADCDAPTYASDMLVCAEPGLLALDRRMRDEWAGVDVAGRISPRAWVEAQALWFKRRSLCAFVEMHADCLKAAYAERIAVLEALRSTASRPSHQGTQAICRDAPWGHMTVRLNSSAAGTLTIDDRDARVMAVAMPLSVGADWRPYVGFTVEGKTIRIVPMGAATFVCNTGTAN